MIRTFLFVIIIAVSFGSLSQSKYSAAAKRLFKEGVKAYEESNAEASIIAFNGAIKEEPLFVEAYLNRSIAYMQLSDFEKASIDAKTAYSINSVQGAIHTQLGKCYYNEGNLDSALYFIEKGIETSTPSDEDLYFLANIHTETEQYDKSIETYSSLLERYPENSAVLNQRGIAYFKIAEFSKAEEDFLKALEHEPNNISLYSNLANSAIEANDQERALDYINRGLEKAEGHVKMEFLILRGNYFFKMGDFNSAQENYNLAFDLENDNPIILTNQASCFIELGDFESAIIKCSEAIDNDPEFMQAYFNRGIANEMVKNTQQACIDWEEAFILGSAEAEEFLNGPTCSE